MIRNFLPLVFLLLSLNAAAEGFPLDENGKVFIEEIFSGLEGSEAELYEKTKAIIENDTDHRMTYSIITDDKASKRLVCHANLLLTQNLKSYYLWWVKYKLEFQFKDGKVRCTMTNFYAYCLSSGGLYTMNSKDRNGPIEKNESFDVTDFEKKNKNASNLNAFIRGYLEDFWAALKEETPKVSTDW